MRSPNSSLSRQDTVNTIQGKTLENILQGQNFHIITLAKILLKLPGSSQDWKLRTALKPASFNDKNLHRPKKCSTSSKVLMHIILYNSRILFACVFSFLILFKRFSLLFQVYFLSLDAKCSFCPAPPSLASTWQSTHVRTKGAVGLIVVLLVSLWKTEAASCIRIRMLLFTMVPCSIAGMRLTTCHMIWKP